ncbi:chloride channel protein [Sphingobacterium sp. JB170]|uniref:chloride channel protein n=1 Tax=Sphingobacterium sp. JB170 TaxID=1434842 RepID=UPI00097F2BFD|nr:chloride channel protein [Sphingobacterium sp. JB170]SJN47265.1 Cl-channel, voltage-gated family protein [Sphingobacterium sp. JB170]
MRRKVLFYSYTKLTVASLLVAILCCLLAFSLKHITEYAQHFLFNEVSSRNSLLFIIFPSVGITAIYFLRKYVFRNRKNKGIKEIYTTLETRKDHLPFFKIPSHYINGFLTVIFGGSTGIEVSTVVATATVGNQAYKRGLSPLAFKKELICAGVVAGVTVLFGSAIGGWLFAMEVIAKRMQKTVIFSCTVAAILSLVFVHYFDHTFLISMPAEKWQWKAIPYMLILGVLGGLLATYFTQIVIHCKTWFAHIESNFIRVNLGAISVGVLILFFPTLYGDSYHGLASMLSSFTTTEIVTAVPVTLALLIFLKPLAASLTLGAGGDGGVFAPSIVAGAFLGILFAYLCNSYFGTEFLIINFALIGAAATLSGAIHGPCTAIFLMCSAAPNGYALIFPLAVGSLVAFLCSKVLCPYNVYSYKEA